ncbi:T9SS response regulator signal transducer PorX [Mangrovivirga cuniculi]|uniref:Two-component system response regulator n=1 Tax=Mangrovivirga cuniculi TaxID=2715131 RepID=A0A4D7JLM7_9BACT|nr:bifunctional response regulator/alkaline phosphatase family protein [Mangrovivirga cuniculi]QCK14410.1 two-component system response regulator [Mangrovivirga cuniculi]
MQKYNILWADDEIDLLKPHVLFLESKGYDVTGVNSGFDALDEVGKSIFDIVFLDENMPGMSGLETLQKIKIKHPSLPVIMITKSEEEHIMEEAIGSKIADYLIKPLNPNQILLSVKKILDNKRLVTEKTNMGYQQDFRNISMAFGDNLDFKEWAEIYKKLIYWEMQIDETENKSMAEVLESQKTDANHNFASFIADNYEDWLNNPSVERPVLSHQLMDYFVFPELKDDSPLFFFIIDNLRYDQWKTIEPMVNDNFSIVSEDTYYSILPTTTQYARNSIFSGLLPLEMSKRHPDLWVGEDEPEGKNNNEDKFLAEHLKRKRIDAKFSYHKIKNIHEGKSLIKELPNLMNNQLNVLVYNFVDLLSHSRTESHMIKELAPDESAYRSLTQSWFSHSPLLEALERIAAAGGRVILSTDHGTIRVKRPFKIIGDRNTNTNLRYKTGKNLNYEQKNVFSVKHPEKIYLPKVNVTSTFAFAIEDNFFAYPNKFNYYVNYYDDTFQHGGVSLEEMIIPIIKLKPKNT